MSASQLTAPSNPTSLKIISRMLAGAVIGAIVGFAIVSLALKLHIPARTLTWADALAMWMSITFIAISFVFAYLSTNRQRLARSIEGDKAELPATNAEVRAFRTQAAVLALAGLLLITPVLALGPIAMHPGFALPVYAVVVLLFALQTALNIRLWRTSDEFGRRTMLIVCAATFAVGQGLIFLWAAAERLSLAPALTGWQAINLLMTCYVVVGSWVAISLRPRF